METITQTNRTILFAEINPERLNLLTLIGDVRGKSRLDDETIKEINEALDKGFTSQKVSALLTQLIKAEEVVKTYEKKVAYFGLA